MYSSVLIASICVPWCLVVVLAVAYALRPRVVVHETRYARPTPAPTATESAPVAREAYTSLRYRYGSYCVGEPLEGLATSFMRRHEDPGRPGA